jgi:nitrogen regulatory protein PII
MANPPSVDKIYLCLRVQDENEAMRQIPAIANSLRTSQMPECKIFIATIKSLIKSLRTSP